MCLAKVYLRRKDDQEFVMGNVTNLEVSDGKIKMTTILKEKKELRATIRMIDFKNANVILESGHSDPQDLR